MFSAGEATLGTCATKQCTDALTSIRARAAVVAADVQTNPEGHTWKTFLEQIGFTGKPEELKGYITDWFKKKGTLPPSTGPMKLFYELPDIPIAMPDI